MRQFSYISRFSYEHCIHDRRTATKFGTHIRIDIGLYRDVWIAAIASSTTSLATRTAAICVRFQGRLVRRVYVTMQITFLTRKSALIYRRGLRQRVASLTLNCNGDFAIRAYGTDSNLIFFTHPTPGGARENFRGSKIQMSGKCHEPPRK